MTRSRRVSSFVPSRSVSSRTARSRSVAPALTLASALGCALAVGCSAAPDERASSGTQAASVTESTYVSEAVLGALSAWPAMRGRTWNVSRDNAFDAGWVLQTPVKEIWGKSVTALEVPAACTSNCDADFRLALCATQADCTGGGTCTPVLASVTTPGGAPRSMCVGHSDAAYEQVYALMTSATKFVDVTSLQPPDGRFEAAIRNALTYLSKKPSPPQARLLFGAFPVQGVVNTTTVLKSLTRDVAKTSPMVINVGAYRSSNAPMSWNHSKIVAVDGKVAMVGGHNLWTQHYLDVDPVQDVSMTVRGSAAVSAHEFANVLWKYTCDNMSTLTYFTWSVWTNQLDRGAVSSKCPNAFALPVTEGAPGATVIGVGRLGSGIMTDGNQADAARIALIRSAKRAVRIAGQDIGPVKAPFLGVPLGSWPDDALDALASVMARGVDVYVVLSNVDSVAGGLTATQAPYANGWSLADVGARIKSYMETHAGYPRGAALTELVCSKLHLAPLRFSADETWPSGVPFALHAKTIAVDEQGFYIGSQNVYPAGLQEYGYIVDDARATQEFLASYWSKIWASSSPKAISGSGATSCAL